MERSDGRRHDHLHPSRPAQRADLLVVRRPAGLLRRDPAPRRHPGRGPARRGSGVLLGRRRRRDHRRHAGDAAGRAAVVHHDDRRGGAGDPRVAGTGDRGDPRHGRRRGLGAGAGQRLPRDGPLGEVRLPLHQGRAGRRRHGRRLPAAAPGRARPGHQAADARRLARRRRGRGDGAGERPGGRRRRGLDRRGAGRSAGVGPVAGLLGDQAAAEPRARHEPVRAPSSSRP